MNLPSTVVPQEYRPNWLLRALYFVFIGWWFSLIWISIAWLLCLSLVGIPIGLKMIDRLPQVTTLHNQSNNFVVNSSNRATPVVVKQKPFLLRTVYFLLIGWWLSAIWFALAWVLCISILGLPLGLWVIERAPALTNLSLSEVLGDDERILAFDQ